MCQSNIYSGLSNVFYLPFFFCILSQYWILCIPTPPTHPLPGTNSCLNSYSGVAFLISNGSPLLYSLSQLLVLSCCLEVGSACSSIAIQSFPSPVSAEPNDHSSASHRNLRAQLLNPFPRKITAQERKGARSGSPKINTNNCLVKEKKKKR